MVAGLILNRLDNDKSSQHNTVTAAAAIYRRHTVAMYYNNGYDYVTGLIICHDINYRSNLQN